MVNHLTVTPATARLHSAMIGTITVAGETVAETKTPVDPDKALRRAELGMVGLPTVHPGHRPVMVIIQALVNPEITDVNGPDRLTTRPDMRIPEHVGRLTRQRDTRRPVAPIFQG